MVAGKRLSTHIAQYVCSSAALIGSNIADTVMAPHETSLAQCHRPWSRRGPSAKASGLHHIGNCFNIRGPWPIREKGQGIRSPKDLLGENRVPLNQVSNAVLDLP